MNVGRFTYWLRNIVLALVLTWAAAQVSGAMEGPPESSPIKSGWAVFEDNLGALPNSSDFQGLPLIDSHGRHYGQVLRVQNGFRLWLDGVLHPVWQEFVHEQITDSPTTFNYCFSPEGNHLAYVVREGGKMRFVLDGRPGELEEDIGQLAFSPDGRHFACVVKRQGEHHVLLDSVPGPACRVVGGGSLIFSPDSSRIAYEGQVGGEWYIVVDQKPRRDWPSGGWPKFSPDSKRVGYVGRDFAVVDGVRGAECSLANGGFGPVFSSDSRHFFCTVGSRTFVDWRPLPLPNDGTGVWHTVMSPNLRHWACILRTATNDQVFLDGKLQPNCNGAFNLQFSKDNRHFAYEGEIGTNWWLVLDDRIEAPISLNWGTPCFSPNGKRLACIAGRGPDWWVMADGRPGPRFLGTQRSLLGLGTEEVPAVTTPEFSSDSRRLIYAARQGAGGWGVLIDQTPVGPLYQDIVEGGPSFDTVGNVTFLGIRNGFLYRVSISRLGQN